MLFTFSEKQVTQFCGQLCQFNYVGISKQMAEFLTNAQFSEQPISVLSTYDSTSPTSGSLLTSGGLGVKLSANIGEQLYVNSVNVTPSLGDIVYEREQVLVNNSSGEVENMVFYNDITQSFKALVSVEVTDIAQPQLNKRALWEINGHLGKNGWVINKHFTGSITNILFTINNVTVDGRSAGQLQYYNPNTNGATTIRYKANTVSPSGASNDAISYATTPVELSANSLTYTAVNSNDWDTVPGTTQEAIDELASSLRNISFLNEYHVSKSGSATGNGSISKPFLTITQALTVAQTLAASTAVILYIHPGTYTENLSITKPNLSIVGMTSTFSHACQINGNITVSFSSDASGVYNTMLNLENLLITGRTGSSSVFTFAGTKTGYININNCKIWTSVTSQKVMYITNTSATLPKIKVKQTDLLCNSGNDSVFEVASGSNIDATFFASNLYGSTASTIVSRGSSTVMLFSSCNIDGTSAFLVDIVSAALVSFIGCSLLNSSLNSSGIKMSSSAVAAIYGCIFSIPTNSAFPTNLTPPASTTGYAVKGVSGANMTYGNVSFVPLANVNGSFYWTTNKISSAVTVTPSPTTLVGQA